MHSLKINYPNTDQKKKNLQKMNQSREYEILKIKKTHSLV